MQRIVEGEPVDLVLSGINHGANLGEDVTYSGTVAAAMEATLFKVPAIAFSQVCESRAAHQMAHGRAVRARGDRAAAVAAVAPDVLINVNFPDLIPTRCAECG